MNEFFYLGFVDGIRSDHKASFLVRGEKLPVVVQEVVHDVTGLEAPRCLEQEMLEDFHAEQIEP